MNQPITQEILVCQNRTCRRQGSEKILKVLAGCDLPGVRVVGCGCLGHCGSGPMVLILPELLWYEGVTLGGIQAIILIVGRRPSIVSTG
ncbi:(2Fe-2S) ferredoxin domain-containing protein [Spirulina subsalsa]|uniref:(2Fe-2S) ferredoxin domain-containing protein n=1 Tax=Spirulina subsalsa TaxID=54311 RepID=UPI0002F78172|nr:(2Fe-2S) ferredoxin domain-containing protein [Spirulina subsalsa]